MGMYPGRETSDEYMLKETGTFKPNGNPDVVRIIMHQTSTPQKRTDQAKVNYWTFIGRTKEMRAKHPDGGVSAHFTVEADGRTFQHIDTRHGAKGTQRYTFNAVHIEFASLNQELTNDQLHYGAGLMAWIAREHPKVRLVAVGSSNDDPGDKKQEGITCHSFVEIVGGLAKPKLTCPGPKIVAQMNKIAVFASVRAIIG